MNVTINGYVNYSCSNCNSPYNVESQAIAFKEDASLESEDDEYIRYLSQIDTPCVSCGNKVLIKLDIWENPTAVVNYSYYSVQGVNDIQCEFTIEHYFDDEMGGREGSQPEPETEPEADEDSDDESDYEEDEKFNESAEADVDIYKDHYDEEQDF